jgi:hypothetical protein
MWLTIVVLAISVIIAVLWACLRKDVQGAVGISCMILAALSAWLVAVFNYQKVDRLPSASFNVG